MYKSPIEFIESAADSFTFAMGKTKDELVFQTVSRIGVAVDKEELLKALKYDRGQYEKGYRDAREDCIKMFAWELDYKAEILERYDLNKIEAKARAEAIKNFSEYAALDLAQFYIDKIREFISTKTKLDPVYDFNPSGQELNSFVNEIKDYLEKIAKNAEKEMGVR